MDDEHTEENAAMSKENSNDLSSPIHKVHRWNPLINPTKQLLENFYSNKSDRLSLRINTKGKNRFLWRQFKLAYLDGIEQPYAMCRDCKTFVKYSGRTGTGGLVRHMCFRQISTSLQYQEARGRIAVEDRPPTAEKSLSKPSTLSVSRLMIEQLIAEESPRIGFIPNSKGKSDVWTHFDIITLDNEIVNFAACKLCRCIVTYISRTGTGSMTRHKCPNKYFIVPEDDEATSGKPIKMEEHSEDSSTAFHQVQAISEMFEDDADEGDLSKYKNGDEVEDEEQHWVSISRLPSTEEMQHEVRDQYFRMLKNSLQTFRSLRNDTFYNLAQTFVNLGAEYGKIDVKRILIDTDFEGLFDDDS